MQQSLAFDFGSQPPAFTHRHRLASGNYETNLFLALVPDTETKEQLYRIADEFCATHKLPNPRPSRIYHVTLRWLWKFNGQDDAVIDHALQVGENIQVGPVEVSLTHVQSFASPDDDKPVVMLCDNTDRRFDPLQDAIDRAIMSIGIKPSRQRFTPHLTFVYANPMVDMIPLQRPINWIASEVVLVRSLVGHTKHEYLGHWPLRA